ncbi:MAG: CDP-alcohol phosphatidyltransferase family protein [Candidatus Aenigmarchaeota archaeon]|nr:CDP-alcohol phosphatidyltransferase family protein [Candidatus Aenigmarchaeota archaeon]
MRNGIDKIGMVMPLPNVSPNALSGLSIVFSLLFVLTLGQPFVALALLACVLLLDWLDGMVARKYGKTSDEGYIVDVASDRLSEAVVFLPFFFPWFFLFSFNCILVLLAVKRNIHIILPLRHVFLVFYAFLALTSQT